jgi:predicted MFS family arabinose efflux permease
MTTERTGLPAAALFCAAHLLSAFGYEFTFFVMTLHAYGRSGKASDVALFSTLTFLPRLFAPLLGELVDRLPNRELFAGTLGLGALCAALIPHARWALVPWTSLAILSVLFGLVRTALMTQILEDQGPLVGNAAMLFSLNSAKLLAPLAGALAAAWLSFRSSMLLAALVFGAGALCAGLVRGKPACPLVRPERGRPGLLKGFPELWRVNDLRFLFLLSFAWRLFLGLQISLFVVLVKRGLGGSDSDYGLFMTCLGLGSLLGSLTGPWLTRRVSAARLVEAGMGLHFLGFVALGRLHSLALANIAAFLGFAALYASVVGVHSLRDRIIAADAKGRVFGANTMVLAIAGMISMLLGGRLADLCGARVVFEAAGMLALAALAVLHFIHPLEARARAEA